MHGRNWKCTSVQNVTKREDKLVKLGIDVRTVLKEIFYCVSRIELAHGRGHCPWLYSDQSSCFKEDFLSS
jgi:hypothetical protein